MATLQSMREDEDLSDQEREPYKELTKEAILDKEDKEKSEAR